MVGRNQRRSVFLVAIAIVPYTECLTSVSLAKQRNCVLSTRFAENEGQQVTPPVQRSTIPEESIVSSTDDTATALSAGIVHEKSSSMLSGLNWESIGRIFLSEVKETADCVSLAAGPLFQSDALVQAEAIVKVCDELDTVKPVENLFVSEKLGLRRRALEFKRHELLVKLMRQNYDSYVATAAFLSPSRIPRKDLPNIQDVPYEKDAEPARIVIGEGGEDLVADCRIEDMKYNESPLDKLLLSIFRNLVTKNTGGVTSPKEGILGLVDQGRTFMLKPGQTPETQHKMVSDTLAGLMTPVLPPFYRIFMSGIVPKIGTEFDGKQFGPWFYAPWLTSVVTPTFFGFLVGPSRPNHRKDGQLGGLVVEKCKFLQESGCKGLCLHQCKLPAQQFFKDELGLPLTVSPNFVTQECQWSFGESPLPASEDPSFPTGCLVGCESRKTLVATGSRVDACN